MTTGQLTDDQIQQGWQFVAKYTEALNKRADSDDGWEFAPGSALAGDAKASKPVQSTHLVQAYLVTASDHLHALCSLLFDAHALHTFATSTIVRGAIESAASAAWILQPKLRKDRLTRTIRLRAADHHDRKNAMATIGLEDKGQHRRWGYLESVVERNGLDPKVALRPPYTTTILKEMTEAMPNGNDGLSPLMIWRLASGFAHGRQWPALGFLEREERTAADPESVNVRFTMTMDRLLGMALAAQSVLEHAADLYDQRGSKPVPPAARRRKR